ncbi:hypothetical protein AAFF_G00206740 [Aldrovandia affinis]|uniref:Transferrin receptor protein 1 n=1 Tax=Aldrovandia affinis TaxID=143900 RepID=A0AAD7RHQ8_9TELE|nr:hypothetical protein AAFF_G00206740 [Aldrovandia affinis]
MNYSDLSLGQLQSVRAGLDPRSAALTTPGSNIAPNPGRPLHPGANEDMALLGLRMFYKQAQVTLMKGHDSSPVQLQRLDSCEATMDEARSTISKMFNGEPRSYTRFNLMQNMEGENSQVEMKLSTDADEETGNATGEQNGYTRSGDPTYVRKLQHSPKNVCFMVVATLLIFVIGYLIGYLAHRRQELPGCSTLAGPTTAPIRQVEEDEDVAAREFVSVEERKLDWSDLKTLLRQNLDETSLEAAFSDFSLSAHEAGSDGDDALGHRVETRFRKYNMKPWSDEHFVRLQGPPSSGTNQVTFSETEIISPKAYLAYSAVGTAEGKLVYGNYGQEDDFQTAQGLGVQVNGSVVLLRAGKISFAEKVSNAAKMNAVAVLIYLDPADYTVDADAELYGHVHLGSGDPYTPGFPSFNHTQFPPVQSSGLPKILAQTITANMAKKLFRTMKGPNAPPSWQGKLDITYMMGGNGDAVTVKVNNVPVEKRIYNVFGVIEGLVDPDRYLVIGAQRDSWGPGFAKSTVGTSVLMELARVISDMKNDGFEPRRSIIFASWSAGEYGSVGATEWLEGYLTSLNLKAFSYINLDGVVAGSKTFKASASPLLYSLIEKTLKQVNSPTDSSSIYVQAGEASWEGSVMVPMKTDDAAYPFLAFSGIPSVSFRFAEDESSEEYRYFGTMLDTKDKLSSVTNNQMTKVAIAAAQVAGQMALRLTHDYILPLDVKRYDTKIRNYAIQISRRLDEVQQSNLLPKNMSSQWMAQAGNSYDRASRTMAIAIKHSDLTNDETCRRLNDRIMRVERDLLSPYVSPKDTPFRHIFAGTGRHTMMDLNDHLQALQNRSPDSDVNVFRNQLALATWTIQGCSNALAGDIWEVNAV